MADPPEVGEVWWVDLEPVVGSEANNVRPCVVIGSRAFARQPVRFVVPLTAWRPTFEAHRNKILLTANTTNGLDFDSAADGLLLRSVALERFQHRAGVLARSELDGVVELVAIVLGLQVPAEESR